MTVTITAAHFTAVLAKIGAPDGDPRFRALVYPVADLAAGATRALGELGSNRNAVAAWLATMTQESGSFRYLEEIDKDHDYAPYWGRGLEQLTHKSNYLAFGQWAVSEGLIGTPDLFVKRPELVLGLGWEWLSGVWFWKANGLWPIAIKGDFQTTQVRVNGARPFPSGWKYRLRAYQSWTQVLGYSLPELSINGKLDEPTVKRLQQWVGVAQDGDLGALTNRAILEWLGRTNADKLSLADVRAFQTKIGAYVDGDWGPGTTKSLQRYLNENR